MGYDVPEAQRDDLYQRFLALADQKKEVFEEDLHNLVQHREGVGLKPEYVLESMEVTVSSDNEPVAEVTIFHRRMNKSHTERASGDGPVDALYRAINHAVGTTHELVSYSIQSATEGADAVGEVRVLTSSGDDRRFYGEARDTDVLKASAEAYLASLNLLAAHQSEVENVSFISNGIIKSFDRNPA
jgi:2-isopropylmalate synthase